MTDMTDITIAIEYEGAYFDSHNLHLTLAHSAHFDCEYLEIGYK